MSKHVDIKPAEVLPLVRLFVLYEDDVAIEILEYADANSGQVLAEFTNGVRVPNEHTYSVKPASAASMDDLKRVHQLYQLKGGLFQLNAIAERNRLQAMGLVAAPANFDARGPRPGPNGH